MTDTIALSEIEFCDMNRDRVVEYIRENHYTGTCSPICNAYGIVHDGNIVGGITFSNPVSEQIRRFVAGEKYKEVTQLERLYTEDECEHNTESWFVAQALSQLKRDKPKYRFVISYSDTTEGHDGVVYRAANALYCGSTDERVFYRDEDGRLRCPRSSAENVTVGMAEDRGWEQEVRDAKHRYVFPLPDQYESRSDVIDDLACEIYDYPE